MQEITPTKEQAIAACIEVENSKILGDNAKRVCRNTRIVLQRSGDLPVIRIG
jgi:hypothetical protein